MAYENEPISKTTLVDGAVRLESGAKQYDLKPGEQAVMRYAAPGSGGSNVGGQIEVSTVDANAAVSWRKGFVDFKNDDLQTVMRALKRYYNVDIQYAQGLPETHTTSGGIILKDGLTQNLKNLEAMFKGFHFNTDGKIVTVTH
jgi:ferric-dicitrate binding protein FerR (iron transport regulator)